MPLSSAVQFLGALRAARSIVLSSQSPLDGDSVGCEVALLHLAPELVPGASVVALNESPPPATYAFLEGTDRLHVLAPTDRPPPADLLVVLDCGDLARFAYLPGRFAGARLANLDHHASNSGFGDLVWVAPDHASTGELVYEIVRAAGVPLPLPAARALYVAMVFDTGRFAYSNTRPATHRYAAELLAAGVRPEDMFRALSRNRSRAALELLALAVRRLRLEAGGRLAWVQIDRADLAATGGADEDLEDLVNLAMSLGGVEVSVLFKELPDGALKASLRSDRWFDVAGFARRSGGGGHLRAAGATLRGPRPAIMRQVISTLAAALEAGAGDRREAKEGS